MGKFRCDYLVRSDLVLPSELDTLSLDPASGTTISLRNGPLDTDGNPSDLIATVIGDAMSLEEAAGDHRERLAEQLDLLTFATHARFRVAHIVRAVSWEEGQREREMRVYRTFDARYPPAPDLVPEFVETVAALDRTEPPPYLRRAMKYFRYGLIDESPEDQFMRLWLALEIIVENTKPKDRVPLQCGKCEGLLRCSCCGDEPTRVPMARQAIESLIIKIAGADGPAIARRQFAARNGLMHGRSSESIEAECKVSLAQIVDELGKLAWHAIMGAVPWRSNGELAFGNHDGRFASRELTVSAIIGFDHKGEGLHPADELIPSPTIKMEVANRAPFGSNEPPSPD